MKQPHQLLTLTVLLGLVACSGTPAGALPELSYEAPVNAFVGQTVIFDASASSDPENQIAWFSFDSGDGSGAIRTREPIIEHRWSTAGEYLTSIGVIDARGNKFTELRTISIVDPTSVDNLVCQEDRPFCPPWFVCNTETFACDPEEIWCAADSDCPDSLRCHQALCTTTATTTP